jgi:hypothetical protein
VKEIHFQVLSGKESRINKKPSPWRRPLVMYFLAEAVIFLVIAAIWWFGDTHTARRFSDICFIGGAAVMIIGALVFQGSRGTTGDFRYQYAQTSNPDPIHERVHRDWKDRLANEGQILIFVALGALPILIGILVSKI